MNNKILVSISIPIIDVMFDLNVPNIVKVGSLKKSIVDYVVSNFNNGFNVTSLRLIDRDSGIELDSNLLVKDTLISNGCTLVLI